MFIPEVDRRLAEKGNHTIVWTTGRGGAIANQFEPFEAIEDGLLTPPLGIAVFIIKTNPQDTDITLNDIFIGAFPFTLTMVVVPALVTVFPQIALFLVEAW